jgi:hypothetical protein
MTTKLTKLLYQSVALILSLQVLGTFTKPTPSLLAPLCSNRPLVPLRLPHHRLQCALDRQHLAQRTLGERNRMLVLCVECIKLGVHCISQVPHAAIWMQLLPWSCASAAFAALERE